MGTKGAQVGHRPKAGADPGPGRALGCAADGAPSPRAPRLAAVRNARCALLTNDLDQHTLRPAAIELTIEDLLPRTEIKLPIRNGNHHFPTHDLPL